MCILVKWHNETIYGSLLSFQKTTWNGIHYEEEDIPKGRNWMSWTHQSSHLSKNSHSLEHQPWRSYCSSLLFFSCFMLLCFLECVSCSNMWDLAENLWSVNFFWCTCWYYSTPNNKSEKPKIPLSITYTDWQSVMPLRIRNP